MKTNTGLVEHCKKALAESWGYVYGTFGQILTEKLLNYKLKQYPDNVKKYLEYIKNHYIGKRVADCVGLIKSYLWWDGSETVYDSATDKSADGTFELAKEKGPINTIPEIQGICLWKKGHVGVYIGNGLVIEAKGTLYGVIQTALNSSNWTHWFKHPFIQYIEPDNDLTWQEIIERSADHPEEWKQGIELLVNIANLEGTGRLQIFRYLPVLIKKVYNAEHI